MIRRSEKEVFENKNQEYDRQEMDADAHMAVRSWHFYRVSCNSIVLMQRRRNGFALEEEYCSYGMPSKEYTGK